jgi:hypothetical protein
VRWRTAVVAEPDTDQRRWELTASAVSEGGQVSLRGLPPLVVIEVLFGVQQRVLGGAKVKDVILRAVCDTLRRQQAPTVEDVFGPPTGVDADLRRGPAPADVADARSTLCAKHSRRFRRRPRRSLEQFLTDPGVRPLPALGPCRGRGLHPDSGIRRPAGPVSEGLGAAPPDADPGDHRCQQHHRGQRRRTDDGRRRHGLRDVMHACSGPDAELDIGQPKWVLKQRQHHDREAAEQRDQHDRRHHLVLLVPGHPIHRCHR